MGFEGLVDPADADSEFTGKGVPFQDPPQGQGSVQAINGEDAAPRRQVDHTCDGVGEGSGIRRAGGAYQARQHALPLFQGHEPERDGIHGQQEQGLQEQASFGPRERSEFLKGFHHGCVLPLEFDQPIYPHI